MMKTNLHPWGREVVDLQPGAEVEAGEGEGTVEIHPAGRTHQVLQETAAKVQEEKNQMEHTIVLTRLVVVNVTFVPTWWRGEKCRAAILEGSML